MSGFGIILAATILVLWADGWVRKAIDAYDRRTEALRK